MQNGDETGVDCGGSCGACTTDPDDCGIVVADQSLSVDEELVSCDGRFRLVMQSDSNLVIYQNGRGPIWASDTVGQNASRVIMQGDGNFVMYRANGQPIWASDTVGTSNAHLALQDDGNLVVYQGRRPFWASGRFGTARDCGSMVADQTLSVGEELVSCEGRYRLVMQSDSNLVLYRSGGGPLWASNTVGRNAARVVMQGDGNFVMYTSNGQPIWASGTAGSPGSHLALQDDGNLVIYNHVPWWDSGTAEY